MTPSLDADFIAFQRALAGQYSLERELGRGGMGIVYLAREVSLDRPVAIKLLPPSLATRPELRERFVREAQTSARLSHPHVVPIYRVSDEGGFTFFSMAWVDGETLSQRVRGKGPLSASAARRLLREVAWALAYAHARGIVHRDVKPDNILIERETGRAVVTDFGIAQVAAGVTGVVSGEQSIVGTAQFMSPEQASGQPVDGRSDLYALGAVGHFALTGRLPFEGASVHALLAQHVGTPAPPLASRAHGVPRDLARAIDRCLAKQPADRFPSGEALADAIDAGGEVSREIPAPIRVWLAKRARLDRVTAVFGLYSIPIAMSLAVRVSPLLIVVPPLIVSMPLVFARLWQTRRMLRVGYEHQDLVLGMRQSLDRRREELAFEYAEERPWLLRGALGLSGLATLALAALWAGGQAVLPRPALNAAIGVSVVTLIGSGVFAISMSLRKRFSQALGELRLKLWQSGFAKKFVAFAGLGLPRVAAPQAAHRPTELAIGMAADQLFAALPRDVRQQLGDVPGMLRALREEARRARLRVDELAGRLAELESVAPPAIAARAGVPQESLGMRREETRDSLRRAHREAAEQLGTAVAALENVRLDLLRLQADGASAASITAILDRAHQIAHDVDLVIDARAEVERSVP